MVNLLSRHNELEPNNVNSIDETGVVYKSFTPKTYELLLENKQMLRRAECESA